MQGLMKLYLRLRDGDPSDLGSVDRGPAFWLRWAEWTASYAGQPYEYAWRVPNQPTTREREQAETRAIVAKREAQVEARRQAEAQAHRPVPFARKRA